MLSDRGSTGAKEPENTDGHTCAARHLRRHAGQWCGDRTGREVKTIAALEVVVSAGAVYSPALLLRSGIGPAEELRKLGIAVTADRPGVGRNFQNHPQLHFAVTLKSGSRLSPAAQHYIMTGMRFSSGLEGCPTGDLFQFYTGRVSSMPFGRHMAMIAVCVYAPVSRGFVKLKSVDPHAPLVVEAAPCRRNRRQAHDYVGAARRKLASRTAGARMFCRDLFDAEASAAAAD